MASLGCDAAQAEVSSPPPAEPAKQQSLPILPDPAPPEAPAPRLDERPAGPASVEMPRTTALMLDHRARVGVTLGHPPGFLLDNPSMILLWKRGEGAQPKIVIKRLGAAGEARERELLDANEAVGLTRATWTDWSASVAGRQRWPAQLATATGFGLGDRGTRRALAIMVDIPGLEAIGVLGAWPEGSDHEATVLDVVRHLERCKIVVGSGCVPAP